MKNDLRVLDSLKRDREALDLQIKRQREVIVERHCSVKVEDKIVCNGYSHKGKYMIVDRLFLIDKFMGGHEFFAKGKIVKKDGSPGMFDGEWRSQLPRE